MPVSRADYVMKAVRQGRLDIIEKNLSFCSLEVGFLCEAVRKKQVDVVDMLLRGGLPPHQKHNRSQEYPLEIAVRRPNASLKIIELLLRYGASANTRNKRGKLLLVEATLEDNHPVIWLLVQFGADPNSEFVMDKAIEFGFETSVKVLLEAGADISTPRGGVLPLYLAAKRGNAQIVRRILRRGPSITEPLNKQALVIAIRWFCRDIHGEYQQIIANLRNYGYDVNWTQILALPLKFNSPKGVELLVHYGAKIHEFRFTNLHRELRTYLQCAAAICSRFNYEELIDVILLFGADLNYRDHQGKTALLSTEYACAAKMMIGKTLGRGLEIPDGDFAILQEMFKVDFKSELEFLKTIMIADSNIPYFAFVIKRPHIIAKMLQNEDILLAMKYEAYCKQFPVYAELIKHNFKKGLQRINLLQKGYTVFSKCFNRFPRLPSVCIDKIFGFLNYRDLKCFVEPRR